MSTIFSFEQGIPSAFKTSSKIPLEISTKHFKDGKYSLYWQFKKNDFIEINHKIGYHPFDPISKSQARATFAIWIYNENPMEDELIFEFGRKGIKEVDCWFSFRLNYTGWRTAWVIYERDMKGNPHKDMDQLIIRAPKNISEGSLYIDQVILSSLVDPRHPTRDQQVPFVNLEADHKPNSHWLSLLLFSQALEKEKITPKENSTAEEDVQKIEEKYTSYVLETYKGEKKTLEELKQKFATYDICKKDGVITGRSIDYIHYHSIYPQEQREEMKELLRTIPIKECAAFLKQIAIAYYESADKIEKKELGDLFCLLFSHLLDQGWSKGSSLGTVHHLGYSLRDYYYSALFLMRKELQKRNLLSKAQEAAAWFSGMGRIFPQTEEQKNINMDTLNTQLQGILASILLIENTIKKLFYLEKFSQWLSECLRPAEGLEGPFKRDGSLYHHCNLYPAYGMGGLQGLTPVLYFLGGTKYRITQKAHELIKKTVMFTRIYCNKYQWLISLSARHPKGWGEHSTLKIEPFLYMALAGSPDGNQKIDKEVAEAYIRLASEDDPWKKRFLQQGLKEESDPVGNWTMNYGALALHRRDHWLVGVRGHSKYLWGNETYLNNNRYGRYITYGQVEIMSGGNPVNHKDSGFVHDGWDWNRWPGTTTIHLPLEKLKSNVRNLDTHSGFEEMLLSDEAFVGGLNIENKNGMFAMKLHEHPKYEGSHRAIKSVFFFDRYIICLGSNIENNQGDYPTETTLFQNHLSSLEEPMWELENKIKEFPYENTWNENQRIWLIDNKENGYYIPKDQKVTIKRQEQYSKSQDFGDDTKGNFATAYLEHGKSPQNESYEYMIVLQTTPAEMKKIAQKMDKGSIYEVKQKDKKAHIVYDKQTQTTGYALFEPTNDLPTGVLQSVDTPCMVMTKLEKNSMIFSLCDPDLRLYEGIDEDQYDEQGDRKEVSVYSRKWRVSKSIPSKIQVEIKGEWILLEDSDYCKLVSYNDKKDRTIVEFKCREGMPIEIRMKQK